MTVSIRLQRGGRTKAPFYTIVAADSRRSRDGRFIVRLGHYNPLARGNDVPFSLDEPLLEEWLGKGARLSETVERLLVKFNAGPAKVHEAYKARKARRIKAEEAEKAFKAKYEAKLAKEGEAAAEAAPAETAEAPAEAAAEAPAETPAEAAPAAEAPAEEVKAEAAAPAETPAEAAPAEEPAAEEKPQA